MAHKSKFRGAPSTSIPLPERIARARKEGRSQQALELSRQLYKHDPTEQSLGLLREVTCERAEQLQSQGYLKDAAQIFSNALDMGGSPEFQRRVALKLAGCGQVVAAMQSAERLGDSQLKASVFGLTADQAVLEQNRALLPPDLQPHLDAVLQAFSLAEAGKDEEARQALQIIGLTSPFMEWRILLRGLLAYYANDDVRAVENWQRLNSQRLPARLAAPLRLGIDADYRAAQPPQTQNVLRQQHDRLQGAVQLPALRTIQQQLVRNGKLADAFRAIEGILPTLRQRFPSFVPRLAACYRWAIIDHGQPEDLARFQRVFGTLPDDPHLHRTEALALERRGMIADAHEVWQNFEKDVSESSVWPGDQARHVRALIWSHIGNLAAENLDDDDDDEFVLPFSRGSKEEAEEFSPSAEECFRRSLELAPESQAAHEALFGYLLEECEDLGPLLAAGNALLERFPEHVATLRSLGVLCDEEGRLPEAVDYLQRALSVNPLEQQLRLDLLRVHEKRAREFSLGKRFDEARAACLAALSLCDVPSKYPLYALQAVVELKAKNDQRYRELVAEAEKDAGSRPPVAYYLMCETIRQKLTPAQKKPFAAEFHKLLAGDIDPAAIPQLLGVLHLQRQAGSAYSGQKTHEKKVLALVEKAPLKVYEESVVESLCDVLLAVEAFSTLKRQLPKARKLFPKNPALMLIEAADALRQGRDTWSSHLLEEARKHIEQLPRGDRQEALLERHKMLQEQLGQINGLHGFLNQMMNAFGPDDEDFD